MRYNPDKDRRLTIRLEDDLREALTEEARQQLRSLCSEIKLRLRQSFDRQTGRDAGMTAHNNKSAQKKMAATKAAKRIKHCYGKQHRRSRAPAQ
jgi:hypothetical protein